MGDSEPSKESQVSLTSFDTTDASESANQPSRDTTDSSRQGRASPVDKLFDLVNEESPAYIPPDAYSLALARPLEPTSRRHTTKHLPDGIPALPSEIGPWTLEIHNSERTVYVCRGDAYDYRWGEGGGFFAVEVYLNDSGANRDDKYHRYLHTVIGFEPTGPDHRLTAQDVHDVRVRTATERHSGACNDKTPAYLEADSETVEQILASVRDLQEEKGEGWETLKREVLRGNI